MSSTILTYADKHNLVHLVKNIAIPDCVQPELHESGPKLLAFHLMSNFRIAYVCVIDGSFEKGDFVCYLRDDVVERVQITGVENDGGNGLVRGIVCSVTFEPFPMCKSPLFLYKDLQAKPWKAFHLKMLTGVGKIPDTAVLAGNSDYQVSLFPVVSDSLVICLCSPIRTCFAGEIIIIKNFDVIFSCEISFAAIPIFRCLQVTGLPRWEICELPGQLPNQVSEIVVPWNCKESRSGNWVVLSLVSDESGRWEFLRGGLETPILFTTNSEHGKALPKLTFAPSSAENFYSQDFCIFVKELDIAGSTAVQKWWTVVQSAFSKLLLLLQLLNVSRLTETQWSEMEKHLKKKADWDSQLEIHSCYSRLTAKLEKASNLRPGPEWNVVSRLKNAEISALYHLWRHVKPQRNLLTPLMNPDEHVLQFLKMKGQGYMLIIWSTRLICDSCSELFVNFNNFLAPSRIIAAVVLEEASSSPCERWNVTKSGDACFKTKEWVNTEGEVSAKPNVQGQGVALVAFVAWAAVALFAATRNR